MMHLLVFALLLIGTCAYAITRGGAPERITGVSLIVAAIATSLSASALPSRLMHVEQGIFLVDLTLLAILIGIALHADRAWPLILAGLQLSSVGAHVMKSLNADMVRVTYAVEIAIWSYPMVVTLAVGTWRHQRRLMLQGYDLDWMIKPKRVEPFSL